MSFLLNQRTYQTLQKHKRAWLALGKEGFDRDTIESQSRSFRRSIYFVKNKKAGEIIEDDIRRIRPSRGLSPKFEGDIIGRILKRMLREVNLQVGISS